MRKRSRALLCLLLALLLTGCGKAGHKRPAKQIIEEIVTYHGCYGAEADEKVAALLDELETTDAEQAALWGEIMRYWTYVNEDMPIHEDALPDDLPQDDTLVLVVLGYQLNPDGSMQDELRARLKVAKRCAEQYPNAYVLCTGGGTASSAPYITEGDRMGQWLTENGLDPERLIIENHSHTTAENAENSIDILRKKYPQIQTAAIISSDYHIPWGALMFEAAFLRTAAAEHSEALHVAANCACPIDNMHYQQEDMLRWETGGPLEMLGNRSAASQYYAIYSTLKKPDL